MNQLEVLEKAGIEKQDVANYLARMQMFEHEHKQHQLALDNAKQRAERFQKLMQRKHVGTKANKLQQKFDTAVKTYQQINQSAALLAKAATNFRNNNVHIETALKAALASDTATVTTVAPVESTTPVTESTTHV